MMVLIFLYNLVALPIILLLSIIFSIFNTKIRRGFIGRFNSFSALKSFPTNKFSQIYWFHCASFGEYQQVETLIEQIKESKDNSEKESIKFLGVENRIK